MIKLIIFKRLNHNVGAIVYRYYIKNLYSLVLSEINKIVHEHIGEPNLNPSNGTISFHDITFDQPLLIKKRRKILSFHYNYCKSTTYNFFGTTMKTHEYNSSDNKYVITVEFEVNRGSEGD